MKKILLGLLFALLFVPAAHASHYDLLDIELVPEAVTQKLVADKIENTEDLFALLMKKKDRAAFSKKYGMAAADVDVLARKLELMQIIGVGPKAATLLQLADVKNAKALSEAVPAELLENLQRVNREHAITGVQPDLAVVRDWIEKSKRITNHLEL